MAARRSDPDMEKEKAIQAYAKALEDMKKSNPALYKSTVDQLRARVGTAAATNKDFKPKLPGSGKVLGTSGVEADQSQIDRIKVIPKPGFVVKTYQTHSKEDIIAKADGGSAPIKIFINVCTSPLIAEFGTKTKLDQDGNEVEGINVPLSLGKPRSTKDKSGQPCIAYDFIVNPTVVERVRADKTGNFRHWVCSFVIQYLEQKYRIHVDPKFKLPKSRYKGPDPPVVQYIRKQGPSIEEVKSTKVKKKAKAPVKKKKKVATQFIKYTLLSQSMEADQSKNMDEILQPYVEADDPYGQGEARWQCGVLRPGDSGYRDPDMRYLVFRTKLADLQGSPDTAIVLKVADQLLVLKAEGYRSFELFLPRPIQREQTTSRFDHASCTLEVVMTVSWPTEPHSNTVEADPGSKPWLLAEALAYPEGGQSSEAVANAAEEEEVEFPEDAFHKKDLISQYYLEEKRMAAQRQKEKQKEKDIEREKKIAEAKGGKNKKLMMENGYLTEIIGGSDDEETKAGADDDNDLPEMSSDEDDTGDLTATADIAFDLL